MPDEVDEHSRDGNTFDLRRAELFEALGHPSRIKILRALDKSQCGFSELKRQVDIESSGNLSFHLAKLGDLVKVNPDGNYVLTDDGKEALRVTQTAMHEIASKSGGKSSVPMTQTRVLKTLAIILVIFLLGFGAFGAIIYQQNAALQNQLAHQTNQTVTVVSTNTSTATVVSYQNGPLVTLTQVDNRMYFVNGVVSGNCTETLLNGQFYFSEIVPNQNVTESQFVATITTTTTTLYSTSYTSGKCISTSR